ncbi:hypothetical protein HDV01_005315 [Terramyces sp. JEL0728]|nr:hypothetical protein HDV01_005315 [Terramyces sp. JEL0728]
MSLPDLSIQSLYDVKGKVALVTGGATGIGFMITAALVQNGATVYIASRKLKAVQQAADEVNSKGYPGKCIPLQADLAGKQDADKLAGLLAERESKLHFLFNNAGMSWGNNLTEFDEANGWDRLFALNVKVVFYLSVALLPLLDAASSGRDDPARIINISSVAGSAPKAETPLSDDGAGVFPSKMTAFGIKHNKDKFAKIGTARDMAGLALFLCSPASVHITGAVIPIDGGATLSEAAISKL